jgi:multiple sugar transport system ATP-binding protein
VTPAVVEELGSEAHVFFHVDTAPVTAELLAKEDEGTLLPESRALFAARVDARTAARVGAPLELAVNTARLHFFDSETGVSLLREPDQRHEPEKELAATQ